MKKHYLIFLLLFASSSSVWAVAQNHQILHATILAFVQQQTAALPGKVSYQVDEIDPRLVLPQCEKLEPFLPAGSQLLGKTSVAVRCLEKNTWSIFVPVQIRINRTLLVSTKSLSAGHTLSEEDMSAQTLEVTQEGGIANIDMVQGKILRTNIAAGQIFKEEMLRAPFSVTQGQTVPLLIQGERFNIRSAGVALNNASMGQSVRIRNNAGGVVSGIARASGVVEITP